MSIVSRVSSGGPILYASVSRITSDQVHPGPLGSFASMSWNSVNELKGGFSLASGVLLVPRPGRYLCSASLRIAGVASLTGLDFEWFPDSVGNYVQNTTDVPLAGQANLYERSAVLTLSGSVTVRWRESGATGTALAQNSILSVRFLSA